MRSMLVRILIRTLVIVVLAAGAFPAAAAAQSVLDHTPNISGDWVIGFGVMQFNFQHRFDASPPPARKVTNYPTFVVGVGLPGKTMVGFNYSTNSLLAPGFPNEWEFFGRWRPLSQETGAPVDLGGQVGYNLAAEGLDPVLLTRRFMRYLHLPRGPFLWLVCRIIDYYLGTTMTDVAPQHRISRVGVPTLLIHGADDCLVPASDLEAIYARAQPDRTHRMVLAGRRHSDVLTDARYGAAVIEFLRASLGASKPAVAPQRANTAPNGQKLTPEFTPVPNRSRCCMVVGATAR